MIRRPNAFQKFVHHILMLRPVTAFFAPIVYRIDLIILNWTKGRFSATEIVGWPIVKLTALGAKTNRPRTMPLVGVFDRAKIALVASSLGRAHNPGWYYNLKAYPECEVEFKGRSRKYLAREIVGEEYEYYWKLAISLYAGYGEYRKRAARRIPIMLLEPKK